MERVYAGEVKKIPPEKETGGIRALENGRGKPEGKTPITSRA